MAVTTSFEAFSVGSPDPSRGPGSSFADVVALANGGYAVVSNAGGDSDLDIFNAGGSDAGGMSDLGGARGSVDQLTDGSIVVAFQDGDSVLFRVVDGTGEAMADPVDILDSDTSNADVAGLGAGNQNFVLVYQDEFPDGDIDVEARIYAPDGSLVTSFSVDTSSAVDSNPVVCALDDGGFAVAWVRDVDGDTQLWTAVYNANGSERRAAALADNVGTINRNVDIAAVNGGFAVVYEDNGDAGGTVDIALMVFSSAGAFQRRANISNPTLGNDNSDEEGPTLARFSNGLLGVAWGTNTSTDTDTLVALVDPATGVRLDLVVNIPGGEAIEDDVGETAFAILTDDRRVHFQTNLTDGDVDGEIAFDRRVSTSDGAGDVITGDSIRDRMEGNGGDDTLNGLGGDDVLNGGADNDTMAGGFGNDSLAGGPGNDTYDGGPGIDTADFSAVAGPVTVNLTLAGPQNTGDGLDTFVTRSIENIVGTAAGDTLTGDNLSNAFFGGGGADTLRGGSGSDFLAGDGGNDLIVADAGEDTLLGGDDVDRLFGGSGNDALFGGAGADSLAGGPAVDRVDGGDGADRLFADATADTFVFSSLAGAGDRVFGFQSGLHTLEIIAAGFGGTTGAFDFVSNAAPNPASATRAFLYDTDNGRLFFDADGTGAGARVFVGQLFAPGGGVPVLSAADIDLI